MMKIIGPQLLAMGWIQLFANYAQIIIFCSLLLIPLILGSTIPFTTSLAFSYGGKACEYTKDSQCLSFFNNVFGPNAQGGTFTLPFTFNVFQMGACVEAVFFVLRSILLTLLDLDYMMNCTIGAVIIYIPVIVIASEVELFGGHAIAFFISMYIPQVVLCVCFLIRIHVLLSRMISGKGTWSDPCAHSRNSSRLSLRQSFVAGPQWRIQYRNGNWSFLVPTFSDYIYHTVVLTKRSNKRNHTENINQYFAFTFILQIIILYSSDGSWQPTEHTEHKRTTRCQLQNLFERQD